MPGVREASLELGLVERDEHDDHRVDRLRMRRNRRQGERAIRVVWRVTRMGGMGGGTYDDGADAGFVVERRRAPRPAVDVRHHVAEQMVDEELHLDHGVSDKCRIASSLKLTVGSHPNETVDHPRLHQQRHDLRLQYLRAAPSGAQVLWEELPVLPAMCTHDCTQCQRLDYSHRACGCAHHILNPINAVEKTFVASDSAMAAVPNGSPLYTIGMLRAGRLPQTPTSASTPPEC